MFMNRRFSVFGFPLGCLLSVWMFFGCLELIENSHIVPALLEDAQESEDYDEDALAQLASGLKSDFLNFQTLNFTSTHIPVSLSSISPSVQMLFPLMRVIRHESSSCLPLTQQLSVLRI